ncbi:MAG: prephenate dehydrogenase/arogenate dehydrogenase family protein, partial [Bdellovibrionota bacterium]
MRVTVIGIGLIGGSMAIDLRECGFATELIGVDANPEHGRQAVARGLVDTVLTIEEAAVRSDLIIVAIPVDGATALLPYILNLAPESCTVTDMGSTKEGICAVVEGHAKRSQFVASHPMAGTENSGPQAALKGLFQGKAAVICDAAKSGPEHLARVEKL